MMMLKEMLCGEKGGCSDGVVIFLEILEELEQTLRASTMRRLPHRAVEPGASESSSGQWKQGASIGIMCGVWVVAEAGCACFGFWGRGGRREGGNWVGRDEREGRVPLTWSWMEEEEYRSQMAAVRGVPRCVG